MEINQTVGGEFLKEFITHLKTHLEEWSNYISTDEMILKSNFIFFDSELESSMNIFQRLILFTILKPHLFEQFLEYMINNLFPNNFTIPKLNIKKALAIVPPKRILCIIDNNSICDKEIFSLYQSKFMHGEIVTVSTEIITLTTELNQNQIDKITNGMKNGNLFVLKGIENLRSSIYKILEMLNDPKNNISDAFRLVLVGRSNIILPSIVYDQCFILNRNHNPLDLNIKESIADLLDNIDLNTFEYMINRKFSPVFTRKLFFHMLLAQSVLRLYHSFGTPFYNLTYKFDKKDFYYCFKFIKIYFEKIGDKEEAQNNNPNNNYNNNNYLSLVHMLIDSFYLNRLMYKEDYQRVSKLMHRFFQEKEFMNEGYFMFYRNSQDKTFVIRNTDATLVDVLDDKYSLNEVITNLNLDEVHNLIDKIPLENYYDLINNLPNDIINDKLKLQAHYYIENMNKLNKIYIRSYKNMEVNKLYEVDAVKFKQIILNIRDNLPEKIYFGEEASSMIFKFTKTGEYINPTDESVKFEVNKYNDFLVKITDDMDIMSKIVRGEILFNDYYNNMIFDIYNSKLPKKWELHSFILNKDKENHIDLNLWLENIKERFVLLRKWLQIGHLEVFPLNLFYNFKLFVFSVLNLFSRRAGVTPDEISLKFFFTKYLPEDHDQLLANKAEISAQFKNKDIVFIEGLVIENAYYNNKEGKIYDNTSENNNKNCCERCPIMGVTYEMPYIKKDQSSFDQDISDDEETINVPIFCRDDNNDDEEFENVEPAGVIEVIFDNIYNEDFWITKNVRISSEY